MWLSFLKCASLGTALAVGVIGIPAHAQPTEIPVSSDETWKHEWTQMRFPPKIGSFERGKVRAFEERETNLAGGYNDSETDTFMTIYIYRPGNPSTSIWFDRALVAIGASDQDEDGREYGEVDLEALKIRTFVPKGGTAKSGLSATLAVEGADIRSTSVALYRAGEWLVKVRVSSYRLSVSEMDMMLTKVLDQLPALSEIDPQPAQFIKQCTTEPTQVSASAITEGLTAAAISQAAMLTALPALKAAFDQGPAPRNGASKLGYCREGRRARRFNVYRPLGGPDGYSVALNDAGFSIEVYPESAGILPRDDNEEPTFVVQTADGLEYSLHTPFRGRPSLEQVSTSLNGPVIAKVSRPLEEGVGAQITLSAPPE